MKIEQKYLDILKQFDVMICGDDGDTVELEWYSPAGEDFLFTADLRDFPLSVDRYVYDFDPDEHVEEMVIAKYNGLCGVPPVSILIEDARAIDDHLNDLAAALMDARDEDEA